MSALMTNYSFIKIFIHCLFLCTVTFLQGQTYLTATINTPGSSGILAENCDGPYELILRRGIDNDTSTTIFISSTGTATIGLDYGFPPGAFPANMAEDDSVLIIPIIVVNDGFIEGLETVEFEIAFLAGEFSDFITVETAIVDEYEVDILSTTDTIVWCRDVPFVLLATS